MSLLKQIGRFAGHSTILLLALVLYSAFLWHYRAFCHDDAFITLPAPGSSWIDIGLPLSKQTELSPKADLPFIWCVTGLTHFGPSPLEAARLVGIASGVFIFLLLFIVIKHRFGKEAGSYLLCLLPLAGNGIFAAWSLSGLDTTFFSLLLLAALLYSTRRPMHTADAYFAGLLFGLAAMSRLSALLFFSVTLFYFLLSKEKAIDCGRIKSVLLLLLGFSMLFVPFALLRYSVHDFMSLFRQINFSLHHSWLMKPGLRNLALFMALFGLPAIFILFNFIPAKERSRNTYQAGLFGAALAYIIFCRETGAYPFRSAVPLLPFFYFYTTQGILVFRQLFSERLTGLSHVPIAVMLVLITGLNAAVSERYLPMFKSPDPKVLLGKEIGQWIHNHWSKDASILLPAKGSLSYYTNRKTRLISHELPLDTILAQTPDYIIPSSLYNVSDTSFTTAWTIAQNPKLLETYDYAFYRIFFQNPLIRQYPGMKEGYIFFRFYERRSPVAPDSVLEPEE